MPRTPSAEVRTALVDAAARVLEREGVSGLTVRAVAAEAGVAPMGVYNHLDGKSGLLLAVLQRGFDELCRAITPGSSVTVEHRLIESGRGYRRFALAYPATYALMFLSSDEQEFGDALATHAAPAYEALVDVVIESQHAGVVRAGDPSDLALQIWSAVHGAMSLELIRTHVGTMINSDDGVDAYERVLAMIARGVAPDSHGAS